MLTDSAALLFALLAVRFASRPPNARHTFGWLRLTTGGVSQCCSGGDHHADCLGGDSALPASAAGSRRDDDGQSPVCWPTCWRFGSHRGSEERNLNVRAAARLATCWARSARSWRPCDLTTGWTPVDRFFPCWFPARYYVVPAITERESNECWKARRVRWMWRPCSGYPSLYPGGTRCSPRPRLAGGENR